MQHEIQNVEGEPEQMAKNEGNSGSKVEPLNVTFTKLADPHAVLAAAMQDDLMADLSGSEEGEVSEVESFILDPEDLEGHPMLDTASKLLLTAASEGADLRAVDPETQARLEALLEAAGIGKLSTADGKAFADPEVLRRLTSSVSCALDEAAAALTRMRAENGGGSNNSQDGDGSLAEACNEGDVAAVRRLLDEGRSVHETNEEGESLLSLACSAGYYELAQVLLAMHANVEDRGLKGDCTPLMEAASGGYTDIVKLLIAHGADVNSRSSTGNTALTYACAGGYEDVVRILLEAGARIEDHNENGHTPLMEASSAGHVGVARLLLERGAGINTHSNEFKESALTLACYKGHLDMVRFLLEAGADQEHKTDEMHTALMEASMDGHVEVARLLLDHGAQVNMPTDSFESPLTLAACGGHVELANLLIERGANLEEVNDEGYTPLMEAAREGHEEMVALLLSQGANINAQTEETQETALTLACCGGFLEVSDFLIKAGADMELGCSTPLMEAAQEGHLELVKYLIQAGASIHAQTATGDTALTYACENGHTDVADILLQAGAELEHESEGGRTPLMKAARAGHLCTVQFLITRGADVNRATSNNDHTVLSLACAGGHISVVELLLAHGADPSHKLKDGSTMLIECAKGGHATVASLLMDYPNNMLTPPPPPEVPQLASPTSENGQAPRVPTQALPTVVPPQEPDQRPGQLTSTEPVNCLFTGKATRFAIQPTHSSISPGSQPSSVPLTPNPSPVPAPSLPIYPGIEVDAQTESNHDTALTLACAGGHEDLVRELMARAANLEHRDKKGFTPLILAATAGHSSVVEVLLDNAADIEAQSERTKDTPLSLACSGGRQEVVELLLARGANKEHRNVSDYTPLSLAASGGYVNIIKLLLQHGAEINSRTGSKLGISPLMLAAMNGHTQAVKLLLDMGSDINAQIETNRNTALTLACFQGRHEVVSLLVDRKANVEHRAKTGLTPLMEAASGGYAEVGRVLLDKGADVNAAPVPSSRDTALTIAADKGHYKFCELLIQRGAQIDVRNKKGNTPLWLAANGGHLDVVQLLVSAGADKDAEDNRKITPLMATFRKGHVKVVRWLVKEVTQFPSDQECMRYIATISDKELLKKCHQSMEIIVSAKDRQAAEANKNANILLEELDMEKTREEKKKEAAARRREKKRQKRKEKQQAKEKEQQDESPENKKEEEEVEEEPVPLDPPAASTTTTIGKVRTTDTVSTVASRNTKNVAKTTMANAAPPKTKDRPSKRESKKKSKGREDSNTTANNSSEDQKKNKKDTKQEKKSSAAELDDFEEAIKPKRSKGNLISRDAEDVVKVIKTTALASESHSGLSPVTLPHGMMKQSIATTSTVTTISVKPSATVAISPKRGSKKEEGWKEVIPKKSKRMLVPGSAVSRVIGRGGCNINAIREVSGAHIELDKQKTASGDRWITIKGNNDGMRQAQNLLNALIKEPDRELAEIIPRVKPKVASKTSPSTSPPSNKPAASKSAAAKVVPTTVTGRVPMTAVSVVTGKPPVMAQPGTATNAQKQAAPSGSSNKTQRSLSNSATSSIPLYSNPTQSVLNQIQSQALRHPGIQAAMTQLPPPFPHPQAAPGWGAFPVRPAPPAVAPQGQKGTAHHPPGTNTVVTAATTTTTTASTTTAHAVSSSATSGVPQPPNVESARRQLFSDGNMPPPAMRARSEQLSRGSATYTTQAPSAGTNTTFADKVGPPGARLQTSQAQPVLHAARPAHVTLPSEVKSTVTMVTSGLPSSGGSVGLIGPPGRRENPPMSMAPGVASAPHVGSPHRIPPQMSASVPQSAPPDYSAPAYSPFSGNSPFGQVGQPRSMFTVSSRPKSMGDIPNLLFPNSYTSDQSQNEGVNGSVAPGYRSAVNQQNVPGHYPNSSPPNYTTSPMSAGPAGADIFTPLPAHNSTRSSTPSTAASSESPIPPQSPRSSPIGSSASPSPTPIGADKPGQERKPKPIGTERAHKKAGSSAMMGEMSHPLGPSNIWSYPITGATLELLRTLRDASSPWVAPSHLLNTGGLPDNYPPHPDNIRPHMSPPTSLPAPPLGPYPMGDKPPMGMSNPAAGRMPHLYGQAMQQYPHLGHPPVHPPSTHSSYPPTGPPPLPPDVMWNHTHGKLPPHAEEPRNQNQGWGMWNQQ
ncbi:PREDICTED: ankyrin repeat domain-containing protein 17-like [Branchiostoma belcheri]|uniref:Ankyrin repeat domain-containing protein 17-like n=1 Tax=Branchiostoma belcheri TaxID=7741 RepID=A0A6P4Y6H6_BRABE|nr:PREDICTED: ankyrin repeat domain-containing protein 17-like [Branchiostoma belcheri]